MKRGLVLVLSILVFGLLLSLTSASSSCDLQVSFLNQDPYPAVPGDYVQVVFQVRGMENPECGDVAIELLENYPLKFDPNFSAIQTKKAGTFTRGYSSSWIVPYKVRIDSSAVDGDSEIEVVYSTKGYDNLRQSKTFDLKVEEVRADFKVFIRAYDYTTKRLTLEVLNTAKNDIKSLVISIPSQENIVIIGGNKNIVGDLDSNDYTSTDFTAAPIDGEIKLDLEYTDKIGERRYIEKMITFERGYFEHTVPSNASKIRNYIISILVIGGIAWWFLRKKKKRN